MTVKGDVSLYHVLGFSLPSEFAFEMPPFRIGPTRIDKIRYRSERAGSDFHTRYASKLANSFCVERDPMPVQLLDLPRISTVLEGFGLYRDLTSDEAPIFTELVDGYFGCLNSILFGHFWPEFSQIQHAGMCLGAPFVDPAAFMSIGAFTDVAIFKGLGSRGFVAPRGSGPPILEWANIHKRVPTVRHELEERYGFNGFDASPFHRTMELFCEFVARSQRYTLTGRYDEGLLHSIIALEMVFSDQKLLQQSVSERVAVATYLGAEKSFREQSGYIESLYAMRSKYVHEGAVAATEAIVADAHALCDRVFRCMLRVQKARGSGKEVLAGWLRELDYLAKGHLAGRAPSEADLASAHLNTD
jgi:hypothetical protein